MIHSWLKRLLPVAFVMTLSLPGFAGLMPINEKVLRTESAHFVYVYQQSLQPLIPDLIRSCEDAYALLTPVFNWEPRTKTAILLQDGMDEHNGGATIIPRPIIVLYAAGSAPGSSIYEPGSYLRRTVFHEFTHILTMDAQYGVDAVLSATFGHVLPLAGDPLGFILTLCSAPPGMLAPNWYLEGMSIWVETEFVGPGRGRNSLADMIMRMPVADNRLLSPAKWDLHLPEWPYGEAAYLYGMRTIEYAHEQYGAKPPERNVPGEMAQSVSRSFLFFFDRRSRQATGESFHTLAAKALEREKQRQAPRIQALKAVPLTQLDRLTPDRLQVRSPRFTADGKAVIFSGGGEAERDTLFRYDLATRGLTKLSAARTQSGVTRLAASGDRQSIYFTRLNVRDRDLMWSELMEYRPESDSVRPVTPAGRYRFPAISPDGKKLAAVRDAAARPSLIEVPLDQAGETGQERVLVTAPARGTLIDPVYTPDGKAVIYVMADDKTSQLRCVDLATRQDNLLLEWSSLIAAPAIHPSGRSLVFSSDRNGVYNLYRMDLAPGAKPEPVTHALGGMFSPDFAPDGTRLAAVAYDSRGYYLVVLDAQAIKPLAALPVLAPTWKSLAMNQQKVAQVGKLPVEQPRDVETYRSLTAIRPDFWSPWLTAYGSDVAGGLVTSFSDPARYQSLTLLGGAEGEYGTPLGALIYQYSGLYPVFSVFGSYGPRFYPDLVTDSSGGYYNYGEEMGAAGAMITIPWDKFDRSLSLSLGYQYQDRKAIEEAADDYRGRTLLTTNLFEGVEGSVFGRLDFFNATAFGRSHSVEQGRAIALVAEHTATELGGDLTSTRLLGQWNEYLPSPLGANHVLKLEALCGTGSGDETAQGFYGLGGYGDIVGGASPGVPRTIGLRGYDANTEVGRDIAKAGASYRFPILRAYRGMTSTMPIYLQQLFGEVFYEGGRAWSDTPSTTSSDKWLNAAGLELNFSTTLLRFLEVAPGLGAAYAFDREPRRRPASDSDDTSEEDDSKLLIYITIKGSINF